MTIKPAYGHAYRIQDPDYGTLFCLCVSTSRGYMQPDSFLAVRIAVTRDRHDFPGWIRMDSGAPMTGYVATDDLDRVEYTELAEDLGEVGFDTVRDVIRTIKRQFDR